MVEQNEERRRTGVLEVILYKTKNPDAVIDPCHSTNCSLKIPACQEQDG